MQNHIREGRVHARMEQQTLRRGDRAERCTDEFVDLFEAGVVDPAKVTRAVVQNAASIAGMVLTTECIVSDKPEPKSAAAPAGAGMGGDFDY